MTTTVDLNSKILATISLIAGKHNVIIGVNPFTNEISAEKFDCVGDLVHFKNEAESFLNSLKLRRFAIRTTYNPYQVTIDWSE